MSRKYKNKVIIDDGVVYKNKNDNVLELFDYLSVRNFDNFPKIVDVDDKYIKMEYIDSSKYHEITDGIELIKTMALLHEKTIFYKDISVNLKVSIKKR